MCSYLVLERYTSSHPCLDLFLAYLLYSTMSGFHKSSDGRFSLRTLVILVCFFKIVFYLRLVQYSVRFLQGWFDQLVGAIVTLVSELFHLLVVQHSVWFPQVINTKVELVTLVSELFDLTVEQHYARFPQAIK